MGISLHKTDRVPLTDLSGKTIYIKKGEEDKYVLTKKGWLLKDKTYTEFGTKVDPVKGIVPHLYRRTGWEIHLEELEREKQWNEVHKPMLDFLNTPEGKAFMEKNDRIMYEKNPELKNKHR